MIIGKVFGELALANEPTTSGHRIRTSLSNTQINSNSDTNIDDDDNNNRKENNRNKKQKHTKTI